jgi:hypothetical protein
VVLGFVLAVSAVLCAAGGVALAVMRSRTRRAPRVDHLTRLRVAVASLLGLLAAGLYSDWVVERVVDGTADPSRGFVSELGAHTQPHNMLFNMLQVATGVILLILAIETARLLGGRPVTSAGAFALIVFAVGNTADGLLPMDCAPSRSVQCARAEAAGQVSWHDQAHTVESVVTIVALVAAMALLAWGLRDVPLWRGLAVMSGVLVGPLTGLEIYQALRVLTHHMIGVSERLSTTLVTVWLATLAVTLLYRLTVPRPLRHELLQVLQREALEASALATVVAASTTPLSSSRSPRTSSP